MVPTRRLAFVLPSFEAGGAERIVLRLADGLVRRGHDVDLVAVRAVGKLASLVPQGARVIDLGKASMSRATLPIARYFGSEKPAVAVGVLDSMSAVALAARRISPHKPAFIVQSHSSPQPTRLPQRYALYALMRVLYPSAEAIVVASAEDRREELAKYCGVPASLIEAIPNGIIEDDFWKRASEPLAGLPSAQRGEKTIAAVGRLHEIKNFPLLLEAMRLLRARGERCRLVIAGEGEERRRLEQLIRKHDLDDVVTLLGYVSNPLPLMRASDLLVLASRAEGFPTVLLEALACGTPVVATDCEFGPRKILADGKLGKLVPVGDAHALAAAIADSLSRTHDTERLVARAKEFTVDAMVSRYETLIGRVSSPATPAAPRPRASA